MWLSTTMKTCHMAYHFATERLTFCQILNKHSKICPKLLKLCKSGKILPNLVTLLGIKPGVARPLIRHLISTDLYPNRHQRYPSFRSSVTRIEEISPLCQNFKIFGYSLRVYFVLDTILSLIGQFFIDVNRLILKR